ncbi:AraC family transcriptional regulator [Chryseobacterium sp. T16E-39]|uniref:helix-turn-helix transcriptional regulator n=1 Tax=Chryseobacterium sp. T16E-39 TaxID=2015076 RepID=UPI000B5B4314|nr:AraC family transcriptional regulator [Chryseobacterium sp. T16E-39]ASK29982.1 AraC family transcriptional regulator [Chryseobacterium sp. T16E-39]
MKLTLNFSDVEELIMENHFNEGYSQTEEPIKERHTNFEKIGAMGSYHELFYDGIHIAYGDLRFKNELMINFESDFETVEMHFDLMGSTHTKIAGTETAAFKFLPYQHNIVYAPGIKGKFEFIGKSNRTMEINMAPELFKKYIANTEGYETFLSNIDNQIPAFFGKHHMPVTPQIEYLIYSIINCEKQGVFKRLFIESKVIELLMLQLEQFNAHNCVDFCSLKLHHLEKIHLAKEIISNNIAEPYSLKKLALEVGTNEFTLKKGFKEIFGTTVFGMVSDIRMEEAKLALESGDFQITQISEMAGYKNPTHFCAAFKKKYGLTPGTFKTVRAAI